MDEARLRELAEGPNGLDKLATALAKAQGAFPAVAQSGKNPHLKVAYSTLDDIIAAVRKPLATNGLSFVQLLSGESGQFALRTILLHESGQHLETSVTITVAGEQRGINALQALGAAITYMKRYSLGALLGISTDGDTDGEGAAQPEQAPPRQAPSRRPARAKKSTAPEAPASPGKAQQPDLARPKGEESPGPPTGLPTSPKALYQQHNPDGYFKSIPHMLQALRKFRGEPDLQWGAGEEWYKSAIEDLTEYATAQAASAGTQAEEG